MASTGERVFDDYPVSGAQASRFAESVEVVVGRFSRLQFHEYDLLRSLVDRCWLQLHAKQVLRLRIQVVHIESVASPGLPSDHAPLALIIARRSRACSRAIPQRVARHPGFAEIMPFMLPSALS